MKWDTTFDHISRRKKILLPRICYESVYPETGCSSFHKPRKQPGNNKAEMLEFYDKNGGASSDREKLLLNFTPDRRNHALKLSLNYTYEECACICKVLIYSSLEDRF